jgi:hypothetical protein
MNVTLDRELAMVLRLPVTPGSGDDAVSFIDLSRYPQFFDDLALAFPASMTQAPPRRAGDATPRAGCSDELLYVPAAATTPS